MKGWAFNPRHITSESTEAAVSVTSNLPGRSVFHDCFAQYRVGESTSRRLPSHTCFIRLGPRLSLNTATQMVL